MAWLETRLKLNIATAILCFTGGTAQALEWRDVNRLADWSGYDYACSQGAQPKAEFCQKNRTGNVAVCWENRQTGECSNATAWCTYKDVNASLPANGGSPGKVWACTDDAVFGEAIVVPHEFRATEQGGFMTKTLPQLNTDEFKTLLNTACAFFGYDCRSIGMAIGEAAAYATPYVSNNEISTTAWIHRHPGEEYYAKFVAPSGYTTCKAVIDVGNGSITGGSTFNGGIQRMPGPNGDGIGIYAVVPKHRPSGQWASFRVDVVYVPHGTLEQHQCWPDGTLVWQCTGQDCHTYPGARR